MTVEIAFLLLILAVMVVLFLTEAISIDLTAFIGLTVLIFSGYLTPQEAFSGFSSSAVITMLSIFIVGEALLYTGIADLIGAWFYTWIGSREIPLMVSVMMMVALLSAFMNNIAATAVLMPAVVSLARKASLSPSRLMMPLSFGAVLGGTTTLVGTPPNILAAEMLRERGLTPFGLFDFTALGLALLGAGIVYMVTIGRKLLPTAMSGPSTAGAEELARVYHLSERLLSLRIPKESPLDGLTLAASRMGSTLGINVLAVVRDGRRHLAPGAEFVLRGGDTLLVEGKLSEVSKLLTVRDVEIQEADVQQLPRPARGISAICVRVPADSQLIGKTLAETRFREKFGVVVVAIHRDETIVREFLARQVLQAGDEILALGPRAALHRLSETEQLEAEKLGLSAIQPIRNHLYLLRVNQGSRLAGESVRSSRLGELAGVTVAGIIRENETRLAVPTDTVLKAGDCLLVAGEPFRIRQLLEIGQLELDPELVTPVLESEEVGMVEAALAPRSQLFGKSLDELDFRERYGLQVLAVWRQGRPVYKDLGQLKLELGDALLLQGPHHRIQRLGPDPDFVVLSEINQLPNRRDKAPLALAGLGLMILLVVTGTQPIHVAAFSAATLVILAGALKMHEAYRAIEWKAIFLVAAVLPVGIAMEQSGAAALLATVVVDVAGPFGPYAILGAMLVLASLLSQALDGAPAVVLLTPVALEAAQELGMNPHTIMMGVSMAASAAFMTPFSHKANLLVMSSGGYRAFDYARVGTPLTVVVLLILLFLVPHFFPF